MDRNIVWLKAYSGPAALLLRRAYKAVYQKDPPTFAEAGMTSDRFSLQVRTSYSPLFNRMTRLLTMSPPDNSP